MTYLDPRKTIWPGLLTAAMLAWLMQSAGAATVDHDYRGCRLAVYGVVDFRAHTHSL
jgi:hypothetical protein